MAGGPVLSRHSVMLRDAILQGFDWSGRARRRDIWAWLAFAGLILAGLATAEVWVAAGSPKAPRFVFLAGALLLVPLVSLGVRRLHDRGHGGGWLVLAFLPWVGLLVWAYLLFAPSKGRVDAPDTPISLHLIGVGLVVFLVGLVVSRVFWAPYWIPSESMKPTLLAGDYITAGFVDAQDVARGDVIVFRGGLSGLTYVARVIGLPGDRVALTAGVVVLNGAPLALTAGEPFVEINAPQGPSQHLPRCGNAPVGAGGVCETRRLQEVLPGGKAYEVLDLMPDAAMDDMAEVTVPAGAFFVLGDNRDDSIDSRFAQGIGGMGMVDGASVIGRVGRVVFSAGGAWLTGFWDWRAGRFWQAVE
jgi:signal peptidase I